MPAGFTAEPFPVAVDMSQDDPDGQLLVHRAGGDHIAEVDFAAGGVVALGLRG
jgi:hypothetical protein